MNRHTTGRSGIDKRKVFIVDDHPIIRQGLAQVIAQEPDIEVCGEAAGVADSLQQVALLQPDLMIIDMSLNDGHGIDLIGRLKTCYPKLKMLVWSMFDEKIFAERVLRAGAMGYVDKRQPVENLLGAIRQVLEGEIYLSARMTSRLLQRVSSGQPLEEDPIRSLTDRELEIFEMIGRGTTTKQIARKLNVSPKTVESHREKIKTKLDLKNAAELAQRAIQWALENG